MRIRYNAPVTLTFTFLSALVLGLSLSVFPSLTAQWFSTPAPFRPNVLGDYLRLFTHVLGHVSVQHYMGNFTMILLLGPILEMTYGSTFLLVSILITALATGLLNILLFPGTVLLGASGVVFMMIVLASITNFRKGEIPLTFILVMIIYVGGQVWDAVSKQDNISQLSHIMGGLVGSCMGFFKPQGGRRAISRT
ncbi:MAG: rhomboid family intramembrane serine protease [Spirochaetaceae bacterium]|nr:rhomboid family intramembrane serine protease [Spirochaetaceae bacterium]